MAIFNTYLSLYKRHAEQYGRIVLLMCVGSFWEAYGTVDGTAGNPDELANVLGMICVTKKNGTKMAGFPVYAFGKHLPALLAAGFTVVCYDQVPVNGKIDRRLTRVISPSTNLDDDLNVHTWTMTLYLETHPHPFKPHVTLHSVSAAVIDRTTSQHVTTFEAHDTPNNASLCYESLVSFLEAFPPTELILVTTTSIRDRAQVYVKKAAGRQDLSVHYHAWDPTQRTGVVTTDATDGLSPHQLVAYLELERFLADHFLPLSHVTIAQHDGNRRLELVGTCMEQLDVPLLVQTIDKTRTRMGQRLFRQRLTDPFSTAADAERQLDEIDAFDTTLPTILHELRTTLSTVPDLARFHQRWGLGKLSSGQLATCLLAYRNVIDIFHTRGCPFDAAETLAAFNRECDRVFEMDDTGNVTFRRGQVAAIDTHLDRQRELQDTLDREKRSMDDQLPQGHSVKLNSAQKGFETTALRAKMIRKRYPDLELHTKTSSAVLTNAAIKAAVDELETNKEEVTKLIADALVDFQTRTATPQHCELQRSIEDYVARLDVALAGHVIKREYRYVRPTLVSDTRRLDIGGLRHPIIERLDNGQAYVPCDVSLDGDTTGYLIYGINSSGKSAVLKAVGLCVLMAQAGFHVPATSCVLSPFTKIMTRIAGSDNLVRGQSSFVVEMEEVRSVLNRADDRTLLLGDEMCRGTEVQSANAIVHTLLEHLHDRRIFFLAATHLHDLAEPAQKLGRVRTCHVRVEILGDGQIVYRRTLEDGAGSSLYGLEVAQALDFPRSFIEKAAAYRSTTMRLKTSRYNNQKVVRACQVCGTQPKAGQVPLDTHHLDFQCNADADGYHGHAHKNALHNLVVLCKEHHEAVHAGELTLELVQTPRGSVLRHSWSDQQRQPVTA